MTFPVDTRLESVHLVNSPAVIAHAGPGTGGIGPDAYATLLDVVKDVSYRRTTRIGRDIKAWLDWLEVYDKAARTRDQYERDVVKMALLHPELRLCEFTDTEIMRTLKTWPTASRYVRSKSLGSFFGWALLTRRIPVNPMQWVPPMRRKEPPPFETFNPIEVESLLTLPAYRDRVLMAILFGSGIRKDEARRLRVRDLRVDESPETVKVTGKGGKTRIVFMFPEEAELVRGFLQFEQLDPADHLWYTKPGGGNIYRRRDPVSSTRFHGWWMTCLDDAGVRPGAGMRERNIHLARHTFATNWLRRGGRLEVLQRQLGHTSVKTTEVYLHLDDRDVLVDLSVISETDAP